LREQLAQHRSLKVIHILPGEHGEISGRKLQSLVYFRTNYRVFDVTVVMATMGMRTEITSGC